MTGDPGALPAVVALVSAHWGRSCVSPAPAATLVRVRLALSPALQDRLAVGDGSASGGSLPRSGVWSPAGGLVPGRPGAVPLGPGSRVAPLTEVSGISREVKGIILVWPGSGGLGAFLAARPTRHTSVACPLRHLGRARGIGRRSVREGSEGASWAARRRLTAARGWGRGVVQVRMGSPMGGIDGRMGAQGVLLGGTGGVSRGLSGDLGAIWSLRCGSGWPGARIRSSVPNGRRRRGRDRCPARGARRVEAGQGARRSTQFGGDGGSGAPPGTSGARSGGRGRGGRHPHP